MLVGLPPLAANGTALQWRSVGAAAIVWLDGRAGLAGTAGLRTTRMHVARDYRSGSKRSGMLYAREELAPGTVFRAWARLPGNPFPNGFEVLLGRRVSAGNGRATVRVNPVAGPSFAPSTTGAANPQSKVVFVHLLSSAIVRDSAGDCLQTLEYEWWQKRFGVDINESASDRVTAPGRRGGWMRGWGHARAAVTTIEAGSVWRLSCKTAQDAGTLAGKLAVRPQIGERAHEGFGWVAVNPPWLGQRPLSSVALSTAPPPRAGGVPLPWPGTGKDASALAEIVGSLNGKEARAEDRRVFREVAARARPLLSLQPENLPERLDQLRELCRARAQRDEERNVSSGWSRIGGLIEDGWWQDPESLVIALDILTVRAAGAEDET